MEIHQLEYFLAVEKYRSFSAASHEISVSQSTLSQQIKKLEDELGVKLFIRNSRNVTLSAAGEGFLKHAKKIMAEIEYAKETMQQFSNFHKGRIKIGVIPLLDYYGLTESIANFVTTYPGVDLEIITSVSNDLLDGLRRKEIAAAIVNTPILEDYNIEFYPLLQDEIVVLLSPQHRLSMEKYIDIADLSNEKLILDKSNSFFSKKIVTSCLQHGFKPQTIYCEDIHILASFVEQNLGVAFIGAKIAGNIENKNMTVLALRKNFKIEIGLAITKYNKLPVTTKMFRDSILETFYKGK